MKRVDTLLEDIRLVSEERHATMQAVRGLARHLFKPLAEEAKYGGIRRLAKASPSLVRGAGATPPPPLLMTQLAPRWWSMHPAYAIVRAARRTTEDPSA